MHPRSPNGRFIALFAVGVSLSICHWMLRMGTLAVTLAWTALSVKLSVNCLSKGLWLLWLLHGCVQDDVIHRAPYLLKLLLSHLFEAQSPNLSALGSYF